MKWFVFFLSLNTYAAVDVINSWSLPANGPYNYDSTQERTKPVVAGEMLFTANGRGDVYALHRTKGYVLWHKHLKGAVEGALAYGRSKVFVGDNQGNLYALNARDGSEAWKLKIHSEWLSPPTVFRDRVYVTASNDEMYALSETQGKEIWHYAHRGDEKMTVRGTGAPAVVDGMVYQGFSDGSLVGLSAEDGRQVWIKRLKSRDRFYDIDMTPYVDNDSVIAATFDGKLYNLDPKTGNVKWAFAVGSYGGFHVDGDTLYVSGLNGQFYALNKATSGVKWKVPFAGGVGTTPARVGNYLVLTTSADPVQVLDPANGEIKWTQSLGAGTLAPAGTVGAEDGWLYCLSNYGNLYAFELKENMPATLFRNIIESPSAVLRSLVQRTQNNKSLS